MAGTKQHAKPVGSPSDDTDTTGHMLETSSLKDQDRFLPIANVSRIMKKALPSNAKISKEAKETVQECVSEFISFITGEASDKCQREKRKTINGEDLLWAMTTLGFENYVGTLKTYLSKYRDTEEEKNCMARQGDQSPTQETELSSARHHRRQSITRDPKTTGGFFSIGAVGIPPSYGDQGRGIAYGEKGKSNSSFYMSTSYENEGKNANNVVW